MVTDCLADYYFTTSLLAVNNLRKNGAEEEQIYFTGDLMIDTLLKNQPRFKKPRILDQADLQKGPYIVMTLNRPADVDQEAKFKQMLKAIIKASGNLSINFPVHPGTNKMIENLSTSHHRSFSHYLHITDPRGYIHFDYLVQCAKAVISDSDGILEETTIMGVPCITLHDNTECPETVEIRTNELIGNNLEVIKPRWINYSKGNGKMEKYRNCGMGKLPNGLLNILEIFYE